MRGLLPIFFILVFSVTVRAGAVTASGLEGGWNIAFPVAQEDSMLGSVEWIEIAFLPKNRVQWTWKRDGQVEKHSGRYSLSEPTATQGVRKSQTIEMLPTTMSVYRSIPLLEVSIDHDSRFRLPEKVLKCKDHGGNHLVFSRAKHKDE